MGYRILYKSQAVPQRAATHGYFIRQMQARLIKTQQHRINFEKTCHRGIDATAVERESITAITVKTNRGRVMKNCSTHLTSPEERSTKSHHDSNLKSTKANT